MWRDNVSCNGKANVQSEKQTNTIHWGSRVLVAVTRCNEQRFLCVFFGNSNGVEHIFSRTVWNGARGITLEFFFSTVKSMQWVYLSMQSLIENVTKPDILKTFAMWHVVYSTFHVCRQHLLTCSLYTAESNHLIWNVHNIQWNFISSKD